MSVELKAASRMLAPKSEEAVAEAIRDASEPLSITGGGTRGFATAGPSLTTSGLSGITLYEPGALTMVAKAGTPLTEIEAALAAEGQMLPFEPFVMNAVTGASGASTIGGIFATNASGPRRVQAGAARDFLLGVRFVDGAGNIVSNGGRVMKNVTGYDLVKLLAGSHGTLGVLTEVSLKVLPRPETSATLAISAPSTADALAALRAALGTPYDVNGAALIGGRAFVRVEGFEGSVKHRIDGLKSALARFGTLDLDGDAVWGSFRTLDLFETAPSALWRVAIKPTAAADFTASLEPRSCVFDWGGGRTWIAADTNTDVRAFQTQLNERAAEVGAQVTRMYADNELDLNRFQPEAPGVALLSRQVRAKFDPRGLLNPGVMG